MKTLLDHLTGLSRFQLEGLLARHQLDGPPPSSKAELKKLAALLTDPETFLRTATLLTLPQLQVAELLALRSFGTRRRDLAAALGVAAEDQRLSDVLNALEEWALAWPDTDGWIRTVPLHEVLASGYGFGRAAVHELAYVPIDQLQRVAYELGAPVGRDQRQLLEGVSAALADADVVRAQFAAAPEVTKEILLDLAGGDPYFVDAFALSALRNDRKASPLRWAVDHGLLAFNAFYGAAAAMPSEVGVALRPDFRAEFDPLPPQYPTAEISAELVDREGAAAARTALAAIAALLDECGRAPIAILKSGGIGVREVRRLAKVIGSDEVGVRLWLTVAGMNGLIGVSGDRVAPSAEYDNWLRLEPAEQYGWLLDGWFPMPASPLLLDGRAALVGSEHDQTSALLRLSMAAVLSSLPDGRGAASIDGLTAMLAYLRPLIVGDPDEAPPLTEALWHEYELMGVGAHLAPTALCQALAVDDRDQLRKALHDFLPAAQSTVLLQSDLTAVATGAPSTALASLLDLTADRESRGGGYTWRFSEATVRRAFDAGSSVQELLAALREAATGGRVPQPLEYLVTDLGRRHGNVRVRPVGCVLRSDDTTLLSEILRVKSLTRLGLTELAPTVLASTLPVTETLAALRAAGYVPAGEHADGTVAIEQITRHRAVQTPP